MVRRVSPACTPQERRAALPPSVLNMQYQLKASIDAEEAARAEEAEEAAAAQVEQR